MTTSAVPTAVPGGRPVPAAAARTARTAGDRRVLALCTAILLTVTLLQRVALPLGSPLSVSVPVVYAGIGYLLLTGDVRFGATSTRRFLLALAACLLMTGVTLTTSGAGSVTSAMYLLVTWAAFCFRASSSSHHLYPQVLDRFEKLMVVLAGVGVLQTLSQFAGAWTYVDYLGDALPPDLLFQGYNTSYPITYGSPVIKANAFVFLEPSVYAQFLGLALLSVLVRRAHWSRAALLAAAMVCSISGTGLLLVAFGVAVLVIRRGGWFAARIVAAGAVMAGIALASPLGEIFLARSGETSHTNSSGNLRFVMPYEYVFDTWAAEPRTLLTGLGAGEADQVMAQIFEATGLPINFSGVAKLVLEYGIPAALLFLAFAAAALVVRAPAPTLALAGAFGNAFLTGGLLQPQVLYVLLPLAVLFVGTRFEDTGRASGAADPEEGSGALAATAPHPSSVPPAPVTVQPAASGLPTGP